MARPLRIQCGNTVYHVTARGNAKQEVFLDDDDRRSFLLNLSRTAVRLKWEILAYCLMNNHFHLCVETSTPSLARGMRDINGTYAQTFNRKHARVGHLFQGRYTASIVDKSSYFLEVARYIVLNPVRARLCSEPSEWPWSSYCATAGLTETQSGFDARRLLDVFSSRPEIARAAYVQFVAAGIGIPLSMSCSPNATVFGDPDFSSAVATIPHSSCSEHARLHRRWRSLAEIRKDAASRDDAIIQAFTSGTFSLKEIAAHFGLHYSTVSKICKRWLTGTVNSRPDPII
jgi:putative transposase